MIPHNFFKTLGVSCIGSTVKDAIPKFSLFPNLFSIFFMFLFMIGQMVGHDVKKKFNNVNFIFKVFI